ncbi:restriction endonuclease subunit S [Lentilactobacillus parabuchneri]|uniref:restriction endonuclease subunit S n=1 Tax=Lentilactobacillus parabuchneri TaxID=152331 RepID=UPI001C4E26F4|nr:restriction endonuclease subunit S [Lentilactobacillus parabuchneri]MBW0246827.1 restriction endonuclease subunit S [Lentilactobacillus parabuchneri]
MKDNQAKYPQLRFKGFTDPWEERKLADVVSISAGGDVDKTKLIEDGGYPVLANALTNSGIVGYYDSYKVEAPAVTVTGRGDVGHAVARHVNFTPVVRLLSLKSEVLDADFLANMLNQTNILVESTGVPQLTAPQLGSYKILYPNLNEQTKIGKLLNAFDNLIALHQRKLAKFKELKQGYLQKMFPQNGSKFPQLRFAGFADAWEQRKLGDITKISTGKLDANAMVENGKYDFYTSGIKKYRIDVAAFEGPSITIAGNGATVGYMHLADNKFNAYQRTYVLQEFLVDRSFMFSEIGNKLPKKIKQEARTGNIPYIVMDMLTELKLSIPQNNSEQQKIGSFFKQLDDTIDLHQRKLEKLQELKKGYLQKMFC